MRQIKVILLLLLCLFPLMLISAEIRALWVLPWSITSPQQVDKVIADALAAGQTDLFVEVRYRSDALYTPNRAKDDYANPEPRSYILPDNGFDPLEYCLRKGQTQNLKIHAWVVVFNATPTNQSYLQQNHIYRNHYDWITYGQNGQRMNGGDQYGYFIDPGIPAVQDYVLDVLSDLVSGYPELDGLHLDYIRYPGTNWGYHPISVQRYNNHVVQYGASSWNQWKTAQITGFVQKTYLRVKRINPSLIVSAAVFANYEDARTAYAQDWKDWLDKGIVDCLYPMAYHVDFGEFSRQMDFMKSLGQDSRFVIGIRAWDANGGSLMPNNASAHRGYTILDIVPRIALIRRLGFAGVALFSYDGLLKGGALSELALMSYTPEILAWIDASRDNFSIDVAPGDLEKPFAANIIVNPSGRLYTLSMLIPEEGNWNWEIWDQAERLLYKRSRYYPKGQANDAWNGKNESGHAIPAGAYIFRVFPANGRYQYYIPVQLGELLPL